MIYEPSYTPI